MRLKKLKLTGFKSFVEPTNLLFPGQLTAVVGPNGCGKSNLIDAISWVLGENAPGQLRGKAMTDVIFNGSEHRRPLGQASVELVFDNSLGRLSGAFSQYAELSIKRKISRDGESRYFLNGSRCRRRDIQDIFMGTGARARGYSIIGQGTVSRLIEAKPEDLRAYLEEAAGVSKYKERRRETLQRISHTRDNLSRVLDIREELGKQLSRLKRQADAARQYHQLKEREKICHGQINALKWQQFEQQRQQLDSRMRGLDVEIEKQKAVSATQLKEKQQSQMALEQAEQCCQDLQEQFYQLSTVIARLEAKISQSEQDKQRLEAEHEALADNILKNGIESDENQSRLKKAEHRLIELKQMSSGLSQEQSELEQKLSAAKQQLSQLQQQQRTLERHHQQVILSLQQAKLKQVHMQEQTEVRKQMYQQIEDELNVLKTETEQYSSSDFEQQQADAEAAVLAARQTVDSIESETLELKQQLASVEKNYLRVQDELLQLKSEQATLAARQQAMVKARQSVSGKWQHQPRLIDNIQVEHHWRHACELVLADWLDAVLVDELKPLGDEVFEQKNKARALLASTKNLSTENTGLATKVSGLTDGLKRRLSSIHTAENYEDALEKLSGLSADESIITPEGFWLAKDWIYSHPQQEEDEPGLIARQQQIEQLNQKISDEEQGVGNIRQQRDALRSALDLKQLSLEETRSTWQSLKEALRILSLECEHALKQQRERQQKILSNLERQQSIEDELSAFAEQQIRLERDIESFTRQQQEQTLALTSLALSIEQQEKQMPYAALAKMRQQSQDLRIQIERHSLMIEQETKEKLRMSQTLQSLTMKLGRIKDQLTAIENTEEMKNSLNQQLRQQQSLDERLKLAREKQLELSSNLQQFEEQQDGLQAVIAQLNEEKNQLELSSRSLLVRQQTIIESSDGQHQSFNDILSSSGHDLSLEDCEQSLMKIRKRIEQMGAVNLAAIEEFNQESERKQHLDQQYDDLTASIEGLEQAIKTMDKETRTRLEAAFSEVNQSFRSLFPRLFGGGRANLELTDSNLLEAGIVVMAQPPGKRNASIQMLSGGEKAMTAVALVFAFFQLNPSPFCLLDEVDAPLDDVNVGRFCELVKEMSEYIQFLFITHNKITMEMADHLMGVTMREPGVSRLVSVDVKQALTME